MTMAKNIKKCVICGKEFVCSPSDKTVTCSPECRAVRARQAKTGKAVPDHVRKKISETAAAYKEKCAELGIPQSQIIKKAIDDFLGK